MSLRYLVSTILAFALVALGATAASAAHTTWHRGLAGPPSSTSAEASARAYVRQHGARLDLTGVELSSEARVIPWRGHSIVRFGQNYEGLPVFGTAIIVRVDPFGSVRTVVTNANRQLDVVPVALLSADEAQGYAALPFGVSRLAAPETELGVYDNGGHGLLAYRVAATFNLRRWHIFVDALTGEVIYRRSLATGAQGRVYAENPVATPSTQLVTLNNLTAPETVLTGDYVTVFRYVDGSTQGVTAIEDLTLEQTAVADATGDFDYPPTTDATADFHDPFAEVNVYYQVDTLYAYFRDTLGYSTWHDYVAVANVGDGSNVPYENAFFTPVSWNGSQAYGLFMGQWSTVDSGYDADVIRHEFTHSIVHDLTNMGYGPAAFPVYDTLGANPGPSAIHEGMADYFACSYSDDPVMGEYSLAAGGGARTQQNGYVCPDHVQGQGHIDGEVWGGTVWAIRGAIGDATLSDTLMYGALATLTSNATFQDYAFAIQDAATALVTAGDMTQTQADDVTGVLDLRGMLRCGRAIELTDGETETLTSVFTYGAVAQYMSSTCAQVRNMGLPPLPLLFQLKMAVPANATSLSFTINFLPATDVQYDVYIRRGELVGHEMVSVMGGYFSLPVPNEHDHHFGPLQVGQQTITLGTGGVAPLEAGVDYYFAVSTRNCDQGTVEITAEVGTGTGPDPDAGVSPDGGSTADASSTDPDDPKKDGCGCASSSATPTPLVVLLGLALLGWIRRRC